MRIWLAEELEGLGIPFRTTKLFPFEGHLLAKHESFSRARRAQAEDLCQQYTAAGIHCILVAAGETLTLCREEGLLPTFLLRPADPSPPVEADPEAASPVATPPPEPESLSEPPTSAEPTIPLVAGRPANLLQHPDQHRINYQLVPEDLYIHVPETDREKLARFRTTHPQRELPFQGLTWRYITCGMGEEALLLLPGTVHVGDLWWRYLLAWAGEFRLIAPTYPAVSTVAQLVAGLEAILDAEGIPRIHVLGLSLGGMAAQVLVRQAPERVQSLILAHTGAPTAGLPADIKRKRTKEARDLEKRLWAMPYEQAVKLAHQSIVKNHLGPAGKQRPFWSAFFLEALSQRTSQLEFIALNCRCLPDFYENYTFRTSDTDLWRGPALILDSDADHTFAPVETRALRELYAQARYQRLGQGHYSLLFAQETLLPQLTQFLRGSAGRPTP